MSFNNINTVRTGLRYRKAIQSSMWGAVRFTPGGFAIGATLTAFQAAQAQRGEKLATMGGQGLGLIAYPAIAGVASAGLCLIPGIGPGLAAFMGVLLAAYPDEILSNNATRAIRTFSNANKAVRHLEMGGSYKDSEIAIRQRYNAINDMNASLLPGRRFLGQEALLMHR